MRPADYPIQHRQILERWESFAQSGKVDAKFDGGFLDPLILQSWQRCYATQNPHQPRPVSRVRSSQIHLLLQRHNAWITSAIPHLEEVLQCLDGAEHTLLLTDRLGCALYLAGDSAVTTAIHEAQLGIGSYWSEESMGTNAIGLALHMVMPIQVVGAEHFSPHYHRWSTAAAPIHNDEGRLIGTAALVSHAENATRRDRALVMSIASTIGGLLQTERYLNQASQQTLQMNAVLEEVESGILMWDAYGRVIYCNSAASDRLELSVNELRGKDIEQIIRWPTEVQNALDASSNFDGKNVELRVQNQRITCSLSIRVVNNHSVRADAAKNCFVMLLQPLIDSQAFGYSDSNIDDVAPSLTVASSHSVSAPLTMENAERQAIMQAGIKHQGVVTKMATELSISRTTLWRKMRAFNIEPGQFKKINGFDG